jgi:hypothetical protein
MKNPDIAGQRKGLLSIGASMVWRRQEILWWLFTVNLVLGALGTLGAARTLNAALGYSLAGNQLWKGFDLGMLYELLRLPGANFLSSSFTAYACASLFAGFVLFISGGILEAFRQDRRLSTGDFFAASGAFFWRFVRLALLMLVPVVLLRFAFHDLRSWSEYLGDKANADEVGFLILAAGIIAIVLVAVVVRLWFDVAKVRTVAENDSGMWLGMWTAFDITVRHLAKLLWVYLRIILLAAITLLIGFLIWTKLPPTAIPATFILLEFMILSQLAARLWQLASITAWYKQLTETVHADSVDFATPHQYEVLQAEPQLSLYPDTELPPADA